MSYAWRFYSFTFGLSQRRGASRLWRAVILACAMVLPNSCFAQAEKAHVAQAANASVTHKAPNVRAVDEESACERLLSPTDAIISTLKDLYNIGALDNGGLVAIRDGQNPLSLEKKHGVNTRTVNRGDDKPAFNRVDAHIFSDVVDAHIFSDVIDVTIAQLKQNPEARAKLDELIRELDVKQIEKETKTVETKQKYLQMTMYEIPGGTFMMGDPELKAPHEETVKSFYVANMPVTQWQYAFAMHDLPEPNPSKFKNGPAETRLKIGEKEILMQPNNPVEEVRLSDVQEYIKVLNQWSKEDNPLIYQIIPNHIRHAHVRLLTEAEWEYLATNGGKWKSPYPDGITEESLHEVAWYRKNSGRTTHPAAELSALMIFGYRVYDLIGNVWEWVGDAEATDSSKRAFRGGGWNGTGLAMHSGFSSWGGPGFRDDDLGFRLAEDAP